MFLTQTDMKGLTGSGVVSEQIEWLQDRGWIYELSRSGRPVVLREYAERKLGLTRTKTRKRGPNFATLQNAS